MVILMYQHKVLLIMQYFGLSISATPGLEISWPGLLILNCFEAEESVYHSNELFTLEIISV